MQLLFRPLAFCMAAFYLATTPSAVARRLFGTTAMHGQPKELAPPPPFGGFRPHTEYTCRMKLPLVGEQSFFLRLRDDTTASFEIRGAIALRDELQYQFNRQTGAIALQAQPATRRILRTFGLALGAASYNATTDMAWLQVKSRLGLPSVRLQFTRASL